MRICLIKFNIWWYQCNIRPKKSQFQSKHFLTWIKACPGPLFINSEPSQRGFYDNLFKKRGTNEKSLASANVGGLENIASGGGVSVLPSENDYLVKKPFSFLAWNIQILPVWCPQDWRNKILIQFLWFSPLGKVQNLRPGGWRFWGVHFLTYP